MLGRASGRVADRTSGPPNPTDGLTVRFGDVVAVDTVEGLRKTVGAGSALDHDVPAVPEFPLEDVPAGIPPEQLAIANRVAGEVPFYLRDWVAVVVLLAWEIVPIVVGYRRFETADLG